MTSDPVMDVDTVPITTKVKSVTTEL